MLIVDAHVHVYSPDEARYPAREDARRPAPGGGSVEQLDRECLENRVARVAHINALSFYGDDNRFLLDLTASRGGRMAAICTLDGEDPNGPARLVGYATLGGARGIRIVPTAPGGLQQPGVHALWRAAADLGLVVNVVVGREQAAAVAALLVEFPGTPAVIEHALMIQASNDRSATLRDLREIARFPNAIVELVDLPLLSDGPYPFDDAFPTYLEIIEAFGPERCVWGSSYPAELWMPKTTYRESLDAVRVELPIDDEARAAILGLTADRLWFGPSR
ncbi:MAG TPA: amidohydrolase family protein [Candidatus Limnocylindrales bacterium]|nr:amidohydrolase family protein [Candidatus Limnocylindrales bacterium]